MSDRERLAPSLAADLRALIGRFKRRLREHGGEHDLTPSQVSVVRRLEREGPRTASSLARAEGMRPQSMSAILTALEGAGLVEGSADPEDGRQTLISLSDRCRRLLRDRRAASEDWLQTMIATRLSPEEERRLAAAVELLNRLIDE